MDDWIKIQDPPVCFIAENHFRAKDIYKIKEGMEKDIPYKRKTES